MKRSLRWAIIMAILGFILGLGFLVPLPGGPETRVPASGAEGTNLHPAKNRR